MATLDLPTRPLDRHSRRRPFSNLMKRLANLKSTSSSDPASSAAGKRHHRPSLNTKKVGKNSPYPEIYRTPVHTPVHVSGNSQIQTAPSGQSMSYASLSPSRTSLPDSGHCQPPLTIGNKSAATTVSTDPDTINSDAGYSKAETTVTAGGAVSSNGVGGGEGSTFSSPTPSVRSLTTTLTTIQSAAPSHLLAGTHYHGQQSALSSIYPYPQTQNQSFQFSHQFPISPPPSAIPSHLSSHTGSSHPPTYNMAVANNILTDNASILTLASSSKRRRRNSLDTNASIRALAPSSLFGGSRESLPLSVLSANITDQPSPAGMHVVRHASAPIANTERASVYSTSGVAPALSSERNSYYAGKQNNTGDGGSVRSGLPGHGRNDSITGSIGGLAAASGPLASPREIREGRISRRNSGWGEVNEEHGDCEREGQRAVSGKGRES
ncbi:hypothetical protein MMC31_006695 [Peltigera leucophlebia]|nr:hypothetical protein [Peltigera leucophlebia]